MNQKLSFPIALILSHRDRLVRRAFRPLGPITIRGRFLDELVDRVMRLMPDDTYRDAVFESLRYLAGKPLTEDESLVAAWRLAGNVPRLRRNLPVPPWAVQTELEWVPLEVISGKPFRNQYNKVGTFFEFRVLAGTPCPMRIKAFWSSELCRAVSRRLGFSAAWHKYPYRSPLEFVRLRCVVLIDPALSRMEPRFKDIHEEPPLSFKTWNRRILRIRKRIDPCPRGWHHACNQCAVGYQECPGATHRQTYIRQVCEKCGSEAYFDPDLSVDRCVSCQHRLLLRKGTTNVSEISVARKPGSG